MGTIQYAAPEQIMSRDLIDSKREIWTIGVIFLEIFMGYNAFIGNGFIELSNAILHNEPLD
jgi:serine/threonine protein kinase